MKSSPLNSPASTLLLGFSVIGFFIVIIVAGMGIEEKITEHEERIEQLSTEMVQNRDRLDQLLSLSNNKELRIKELEKNLFAQNEALETLRKSLSETKIESPATLEDTAKAQDCRKSGEDIANRIITGSILLSESEMYILNELIEECDKHLSPLEKSFIERFSTSRKDQN